MAKDKMTTTADIGAAAEEPVDEASQSMGDPHTGASIAGGTYNPPDPK